MAGLVEDEAKEAKKLLKSDLEGLQCGLGLGVGEGETEGGIDLFKS
jgi:hypothetical protein